MQILPGKPGFFTTASQVDLDLKKLLENMVDFPTCRPEEMPMDQYKLIVKEFVDSIDHPSNLC